MYANPLIATMNVVHDGIPNGDSSPPPMLPNSSFIPSTNLLTSGTETTTVFAMLLRHVEVHCPITNTMLFPVKAFLMDSLAV
jgi:hypothetical protein